MDRVQTAIAFMRLAWHAHIIELHSTRRQLLDGGCTWWEPWFTEAGCLRSDHLKAVHASHFPQLLSCHEHHLVRLGVEEGGEGVQPHITWLKTATCLITWLDWELHCAAASKH
jgi:hypothetical protein